MKKQFAALLAVSALTGPAAAWAQDAAPDSPAQDEGGLEEIIVTAQKRAEGLSDVPISISAISGKQVENYGQTNLEQISSSVPNLKITQTAIANRIAIRGIASGDNKGFEQSVAMFVDGVYYGRDQLSRLPLVDMERVEVLRGPQPTLFGKNAIAGAVNITTRSPTEEFEGSVSGLYEFNHKELQLTGVLSGPLSDGVEARVVGYYRKMDGYFYNAKLDRDEPNVDEKYFRGKLEFDRGGPFAAELKLEYADFEMKVSRATCSARSVITIRSFRDRFSSAPTPIMFARTMAIKAATRCSGRRSTPIWKLASTR
jgi:outer membrane receptor protein involved in Fe transport